MLGQEFKLIMLIIIIDIFLFHLLLRVMISFITGIEAKNSLTCVLHLSNGKAFGDVFGQSSRSD